MKKYDNEKTASLWEEWRALPIEERRDFAMYIASFVWGTMEHSRRGENTRQLFFEAVEEDLRRRRVRR